MGQLSDTARLHWPFIYAASNGYGRFEIEYLSLLEKAFRNFHQKPSEESLAAVLAEYRDANLLFVYEVDGVIWGAWDSNSGQQYFTLADKRSPAPPEAEFSKWKQSYRVQKHGVLPPTGFLGASLITNGLAKTDPDSHQNDPVLATDTQHNTTHTQQEEKQGHSVVEASPANLVTLRRPAQSQSLPVAEAQVVNGSHPGNSTSPPIAGKLLPFAREPADFIKQRECFTTQFWLAFCESSGKKVTPQDFEDAFTEWTMLRLEEQLKAVRYVSTYVEEVGEPPGSKYFKKPQYYLRDKLWTAVSYSPKPKAIQGRTGDDIE